jgi:hypothetical protein
MPTDAEFAALTNNCTATWTTTNGVRGCLVTGKGAYADRSIFLPTAGYGSDSTLGSPNSQGYYWSSTPDSEDSHFAWHLYFNSNNFRQYIYYGRQYGLSVRPVRDASSVRASAVELVDIPVTSILWNDNYDADGNRPASVTVRLYADGVKVDSHVLTAAEDWQFTFAGKPRYQEDGTTEIAYTVGEDTVAMYAAIVNGYTIVNDYRPELTSVSVSKVWNDDNDRECKRPSSIWMKLSNGLIVNLDNANGWTATISDLPAVLNGQPVQYTWSEQSVLGYELESVTQQGNLTIFTNKIPSPEGPSQGSRPKPGGGGYGDEDPDDDTPP